MECLEEGQKLQTKSLHRSKALLVIPRLNVLRLTSRFHTTLQSKRKIIQVFLGRKTQSTPHFLEIH